MPTRLLTAGGRDLKLNGRSGAAKPIWLSPSHIILASVDSPRASLPPRSSSIRRAGPRDRDRAGVAGRPCARSHVVAVDRVGYLSYGLNVANVDLPTWSSSERPLYRASTVCSQLTNRPRLAEDDNLHDVVRQLFRNTQEPPFASDSRKHSVSVAKQASTNPFLNHGCSDRPFRGACAPVEARGVAIKPTEEHRWS